MLKRAWIFIYLLICIPSAGRGAVNSQASSEAAAWAYTNFGFDFGIRPIGRFGKQENINVPPGDLLVKVGSHYWIDHFVAPQLSFAFGMDRGAIALGGGIKLNVLEVISGVDNPAKTGGTRGLFSPIMKHFMFFASAELMFYKFPEPGASSGLTYKSSFLAFQPGVGAHWYINVNNRWAQRLYLETSLSYMRSNEANYMIPFLGLGVELK